MPGVNDFNGNWLPNAIANALANIRALQTQQQMTLSNLQGQAVLNFGLVPGSNPAAFGMQFVNPASGGQLMFVGEDGAGNAYMAFYDGNGNMRSKYDASAYHVYDGSGTERVRLGLLANGDYGLQVIDTLGNSEEILPAVQQFVSTQITVTSQTYVSQGGPSVTAVVGASGKVKVEASAFVAANAASVGAWVALAIDGTPVLDLTEVDSAGGQITTSFAFNGIRTGLSAGSHTFELYYKWTSASGNANFSNRSLLVTPI